MDARNTNPTIQRLIEAGYDPAIVDKFVDKAFRTGATVYVNGRIELHQHNLKGTRTRVIKCEKTLATEVQRIEGPRDIVKW